ncbi:phosphoribosyltransferase [Leifsonia sp. A12D58]|uniref:phosphoribosyltransferase n=1 Tax=Leifsonia sp. A12D58 TaxID=3397674 RepID=UPI0039E078B3
MRAFTNRADAGQRLAPLLEHLRDVDPVVMAIPRGGVPVAAAVADFLDAPLDLVIVRKLGYPPQPEVALGAIGEDGVRVLNSEFGPGWISDSQLNGVEERERAELDDRVARWRIRDRINPAGRTVIVVDDGVATGSTAEAACRVMHDLGASQVVLAIPVCPVSALDRLPSADEIVSLHTPESFFAVGEYYDDFRQTADDEVSAILNGARHADTGPDSPVTETGTDTDDKTE